MGLNKSDSASELAKVVEELQLSYELLNVKVSTPVEDENAEPPPAFSSDRHFTALLPLNKAPVLAQWRLKERMKTASVALVMCMNIGVDPPDVIKTQPCARTECWIDPLSLPPQKALETIGKVLQSQYERWQPRARYKQSLDPTVEDVKKVCVSLRRHAKSDRVLFHYHGHGVPRPTSNGEIWVFNKTYTQYIPLSVYDLQMWIGAPSIYVFDCSHAGLIVKSFETFSEQRSNDPKDDMNPASPPSQANPGKYIILAACGAKESLPMNPELPADVFTSCLTTPIRVALKWFCSKSPFLRNHITPEMVDDIPGRLNDRRTPLGELNWIFTAITDTIAWNILPRDIFQRLFRQDLLVASLFRNFLLAQRIMRSCNCSPISIPALPQTYQHPLWQAWDHAADLCLRQLPRLLQDPKAPFEHSQFFAEQLTAFEVWLQFGSMSKQAPEQLPIVLQVLLSQAHRLRALLLLGRFLDMGPWAVNLALSVGIFPYVLKLLQSYSADLRHIMVFIWAKILAHDSSCRSDLVKEKGHIYFTNILGTKDIPPMQRTLAAFVLSVIMNGYPIGQQAVLGQHFLTICVDLIREEDPLLRRWACLSLGKLWEDYEAAKTCALQEGIHELLCTLLTDPIPEVRASCIFALGCLLGGTKMDAAPSNPAQATDLGRTGIEINICNTLTAVTIDASPLVRRELVVTFAYMVRWHRSEFEMIVSGEPPVTPVADASGANGLSSGDPPVQDHSQSYAHVWTMLSQLADDPNVHVAEAAQAVVRQFDPVQHVIPESPVVKLKKANSARLLLSPRAKKRHAAQVAAEERSRERAAPPNLEDFDTVVHPSDSWPPCPVRSTLFSWCRTKFALPMTIPVPILDESDLGNVQRKWRRHHFDDRTRRVIDRVRNNPTQKIEEQVAILDNATDGVSQILLHPYEPYLLASDNSDSLTVWNWSTGAKRTVFRNGNSHISRITALGFLNDDDATLVLSGSDDGAVRLWRNVFHPDVYTASHPDLVSAWRAVPDLSPHTRSNRGPGLVVDWQPRTSYLVASGDVRYLMIWDVERELCVQGVPSGTDSCVTSMTSDKQGGNVIVAGCGDGTVRLFDKRLPAGYDLIKSLHQYSHWVVNVYFQPGGDRRLITGTVNGEVSLWDMRMDSQQLITIDTAASTGKGKKEKGKTNRAMTALAFHDHAPVFACGSNDQVIKIYDTNGRRLNHIRYHDGFLGQRIGPVSALAFHPVDVLLASGATDSIVSLYAADKSVLV